MVDSDSFLTNWGGEGSIFERIRSGSGTPRIKIGLLTGTAAGSSVMAIAYVIIAYFRQASLAAQNLVDAVFGFFEDMLAVLIGDGIWIRRGSDSVSIDGPVDYVDSVFGSAESTLSTNAWGFIVGVALILGLATVVWGVRRYAL